MHPSATSASWRERRRTRDVSYHPDRTAGEELRGCDRAQDAVDVDLRGTVPAVRPGRVEERRPRAARSARAESDPPDARHRHRQPPAERPAIQPAPRVDVDPPATEVRDEQLTAEPSEAARRKRDAPRLVELVRVADPRDEPAVAVELVDVAASRGVVAVHRRAP